MNDKKGVNVYDYSNQTFIFSLSSMKKFDQIEPNKKKAIYNWEHFGPNFGDGNIRLKENLEDGDCYSNFSCSFIKKEKELIGNDHFLTKELEIFKVIY